MGVVIVLIFSCIVVASCSRCDPASSLIKPSPMNNLKKISDKLYQTVSSNDYLSAEYSCATISDVHVNSELDGYTALITNYYRETDPQSFYIYQRIAASGYLNRIKIDDLEITSHRIAEKGKANYEAEKELDYISDSFEDFSMISDGYRYYGYVNCTPEGWAVWIYTPEKILTTEGLLFIHNELEKYGIHTQLRLGECGNISPE